MALVPRWRLDIRVRAAWTIFLALYSGVVGVALVLDRTLSKKVKFVHEPRVLITLVGALALATFIDATKRAMYRLRATRLDKNRVEIRDQLASVIVSVAKLHSFDLDKLESLGCGLFLIQDRGLKRPQRLVRVERVRIVDQLPESGVLFTKNKGTVGKCWNDEHHAHADWIAINRKYAPTSRS